MTFPLLPDAASKVARQTDHLYWALIGLCGAVMLLVFLLAMVCGIAHDIEHRG